MTPSERLEYLGNTMSNTPGRERWLAKVGEPRQASGDIPSASAIYRHASAKDGSPKLEVATLFESFTRSVEKYADNKCLGWREKAADGSVGPYVWKTYKEVGAEVVLLASGLKSVGAATQGRIGVFGSNSPEWMMAMQASSDVPVIFPLPWTGGLSSGE